MTAHTKRDTRRVWSAAPWNPVLTLQQLNDNTGYPDGAKAAQITATALWAFPASTGRTNSKK
jgi:hypothetical protein